MTRTLPAMYDENGKHICGAKTRAGGKCKTSPMRGYNRCRIHKGFQGVRGPAHPAWKGGKDGEWARRVPERMRQDFERETQNAEEELSATQHIGLVDSRILDLLSKVDAGATAQLWLDVRREWRAFTIAQAGGDVPGMQAANARLDALINHGASDAAAWEEIGRQIDRAIRARDAETRRRVAGKEMIRLDRLEFMRDQLAAILHEEIQDRPTLARIAQRIGQVM